MAGKRIFTVLTAAAIGLLTAFPAFAGNRVSDIEVDVTLYPDGSAYVVQTWSGSFDEGTEVYFPVTNLGEMTLSNLMVSDGQGTYTALDEWDTKGTFEEKARSCGLNPVDGGYEVCWGISDYGDNRYAVEYRLSGLAAAYEDFDGFLFQFVPSGMNTVPTDAVVRIHTQEGTLLSEENTGIWAFGFEGQIGFSSGSVLAYTDQPLQNDSDSVIVMLQLDKGLLTPARQEKGSFEAVKKSAFEDSDYEEESSVGFWAIVVLVALGGVLTLAFIGGAEGRRIKKVYKAADYYREAPVAGNLEAVFVLARRLEQSRDDGNLITGALIKLLAAGCLTPLTDREAGPMGREKKEVSLKLVKPPEFRGVTTELLYELLVQAAGSDGILQEKELENYCKSNYTAMLGILSEARRDGDDTLETAGCYKSLSNTESLSGLTERGQKLLHQIMGYKKYLLEFSLISERGVNEALIWQECLTFAALLGIADTVMKELKSLSPGMTPAVQVAELTYYAAYRYQYVTYQAAKNAESAAERAAGGGGSSSLGGGGGFSGGGSGGGSR